MDNSLLDIEKSLKKLKMPEASDTALWRLEDLVDELASDGVVAEQSPQTGEYRSGEWFNKLQRQPRLLFYSVAACFLACMGAGFYGFDQAAQRTNAGTEVAKASELRMQADDKLISSVSAPEDVVQINREDSASVNASTMSMEFVRSDTVVEMLAVEEGFSEDRNAFFRVERYSVLDSDIYKDPTSGHTVTLQQTSNEERRAPVTFF